MALDTYQDLKDSIADWLNREDSTVTSRIPDFILLAEKKIWRRLRVRYNEAKEVYAEGGTNPQGITLPDGFKEVRLLTWDGYTLDRKTSQWYFAQEPGQAAPDRPYAFARTTKSLIEFFPPPDNDAEVVLYHYEEQGPISDTVLPELFVEFPDVYLYGALVEAEPFLRSKDLGAFWKAKYNEAMLDITDESEEDEVSGATVEVSSPYPDGRRDYGVS